MNSIPRRFSSPLLVSLLLLLIGCGQNVKLTGKVTFSDDDSPLTVGFVCFEKADFFARGPIESDGTYTMESLRPGDGLPLGRYSVYIAGLESDDGGSDAPIDRKFFAAASSGLSCEVTSATKTFDFQVDRNKK